ncbi:MAG TPA: DUF3857 and transglutaminase domain-containing protein, partial [Candidatus Omnitrophota bacterium]|nr:DUF3857 and transglutaminase domain-containing protein [Candidatus Omnitrophota bacterium]
MKKCSRLCSAAFLVSLVFCALSSAENDSPFRDYTHPEKMPILVWAEIVEDLPYYFLEETREAKLNDDWSIDERLHYRLKIQKELAKEQGEQRLYYNNSREEITDIQAFVETPDGKKYPFTSIQDLDVVQETPMYSDLKVKVITLPQVNIGSVIDVTVTSRMSRDAIPDQFSRIETYPDIPHQVYKATYTWPKDKNILVKPYRTTLIPAKSEKDGKVSYVFEYKRTFPIQGTEPFLPPYNEVFGFFSISSLKDWQSVADWYRDLIQKNIRVDENIRRKVNELCAGKASQSRKARAILEFLQDNMRYVSMSFGEHAVEPHPTDEIFNNMYGDCKDWSLLAKQMLNIAGIKADLCLFNDELAGDPQWGLPSVSLFDHVILEVELDGKKFFVDPQLKNFDWGQYPQEYNNAYLLVIQDEGYRFANIPVASVKETKNLYKILCRLNAAGAASYDVIARLNTEVSNYIRLLWRNIPQESKGKFFEDMETQFARGGQLTNPRLDGVDTRYGPVLLKFNVRALHAYQKTNEMIILSEPVAQYFPNPFSS